MFLPLEGTYCLVFLHFLIRFSVHGEDHLPAPNDKAGCPFLVLFLMICIKSCFNSFTYLPNNHGPGGFYHLQLQRSERNPLILNFLCPLDGAGDISHYILSLSSLASDFLGSSGLRQCTDLSLCLMRNGCMSTPGKPQLVLTEWERG